MAAAETVRVDDKNARRGNVLGEVSGVLMDNCSADIEVVKKRVVKSLSESTHIMSDFQMTIISSLFDFPPSNIFFIVGLQSTRPCCTHVLL